MWQLVMQMIIQLLRKNHIGNSSMGFTNKLQFTSKSTAAGNTSSLKPIYENGVICITLIQLKTKELINLLC